MRISLYLGFLLTAFLSACGSMTTVAYNLPEREANEIVVLMSNHGIAAQKIAAPTSSVGGASTQKLWNIMVPAKSTTAAIGILNQAGLPRAKGTSLLDLFGVQGLVPSEMQNKIRYQEGLSEQLATTIRKMDGIIDADVQITFPQDDTVKIPLTASVYIKHRGVLDNPNSLMISKIKRLVSSALPGLTIDNVSVITDRALFADMTVDNATVAEEHEYVSIWGIIIAQQSVTHFRLLLFFLLFLLFVITSLLVWLVWKIHLMLKSWGIMTLLNPKPYEPVPSELLKEDSLPVPSDEGEEL